MGNALTNTHRAAPPQHPEMIKARMRIVHGSVRQFEIDKGLAATSVKDVFRGRAVRRTAQAIADFVGIPLAQLFPGRFIAADHKTPNGDAHSLNSAAN